MTATPEDMVLCYLQDCRIGTSEDVLARVLGLSDHEIGGALDALVDRGDVRVVRRTRSRVTYGAAHGRKAGEP